MFPQQPQPPPGLTLQPLLLGSGWELSALEAQEMLNPSHWPRAARTGRHRRNKSAPVHRAQHPQLGRALPGEGAWLLVWERHLAAAWST